MPERRDAEASPSDNWADILRSDPDHERHLEFDMGRFQAIINIAKTGSMVLEVLEMDNTFKHYHEISDLVNEAAREKVNQERAVAGYHLRQTISTVGAAARSDIDEKYWKLTAFGLQLKPALIFIWEKLLEHGINPSGALGSLSRLKKDEEGNLVVSPAMTRAFLLIALSTSGTHNKVRLISKGPVTATAIENHLESLKASGLVTYESITPGETISFFKLTDKGISLPEWPTYIDSKGGKNEKISRNLRLAIAAIVFRGKTVFSYEDIKQLFEKSGLPKNLGTLAKVLNFFVNEGLVEFSGPFRHDWMSQAEPTEKGGILVDEVFLPVLKWCQDINSVEKINQIGANLGKNPAHYRKMYPDIVRVYKAKSPFRGFDSDAKKANILNLIAKNPGTLTASQVGKRLGISDRRARQLINSMIQSSVVRVCAERSNRKLLELVAA